MPTRKSERVSTSRTAIATIPGSDFRVLVRDISVSGCRLSTDSALAKTGSTIIVSLAGLEMASGQIAWVADGECGVKFHRPITEEAVDQISGAID
ncbi:PilZ domain-containing protein [Altererythrobacter xiamenensis]|uniref:PilZ domain-containing protein n=1 Tax=Altererythrobacter xiamenensis TaxID=1316679 RepID=A0A1Y6F4V4_9SPHN|nr:PilZ domain-containing protein [Altererythrobacter xiamenensis]SMQ69549.1 PilZ domain-containing protein [Altererythrobacter xiamenensis]